MIDAAYFRHAIGEFVREYAAHRGLQANTADLQVTAELADRTAIYFTAWRAGDGWIVFFTEDDEMVTVPYDAITKVSVRSRLEPLEEPARRPVGFAAVDDPEAG